MSRAVKVAVPVWHYRDSIITIDQRGEFRAEVNGTRLRAGSLDAMKKKIAATDSFEPFEAIVKGFAHSRIPNQRVNIVAIRGQQNPRWVDAHGREHDRIIRWSPKAARQVAAYAKASRDEESRHEKARHQIGEMADALPWESPE